MKRYISVFLAALALLAVIMSGCSSGNTDPSLAGIEIPAGMKLISPLTAEYYLFVSENWKSDITTGVVSAYYSESDPTNICLMAFSLGSQNMSYEDYWKQYEPEFSNIYKNYTLIDSSETIMGGVTAGCFIYSGTFVTSGQNTSGDDGEDGSAGVDYKFMSVVAIKDRNIYILTYSARESAYETHLGDFTDTVKAFTFK
ncbi:MAG: hypothetical protein J6128_02715 [Clostridia bacterium]|nr:hypothetical protein [Clostridia bacterium]MBP5236429.1 hypothetical protein [Clostridia bacterium]